MKAFPIPELPTPTPLHGAPQHGPRPLPLFLAMVADAAQHDAALAAAAMEGLRRVQSARRAASPQAMPVAARAGRAALRDYGGHGQPVIFVPSLINPPAILDLIETRSLLRWMAGQGFRVLLVDWGDAAADDPDVAGHAGLVAALVDAIGETPHLVGYCLGGTIAAGVAAVRRLRSLTLIATPWRFAGFGDAARADLADLWAKARPAAETIGLLPMEVMQSGFWRLDPQRTVAKYARFAALAPDSEEAAMFVAMEDWANAGPPLPLAAAREAFEDFFAHDVTGAGAWHVGGTVVDPAALGCPVLDIVSASDRIVPAASATGLSNRLLLARGHVGMVVGGRARATLWQPLADWLRGCADPSGDST